MIRYPEAQGILASQSFAFETESVPLREARGRILARGIASPIDIPPFCKSAMDGFAVAASDPSPSFRIVEVIQAGKVPEISIGTGECAKIMTGAMLPAGADRVIKKEAAAEENGFMRVTEDDPKPNVIPRGEDLRTGEPALPAGARIGPAEVAFLASIGQTAIPVYRRPSVGLIITGSELVEPGAPLPPGKIYNSNFFSLASQVEAMGALVGERFDARDVAAEIEDAIRAAAGRCRMVILSGGASEGDFDFVPAALKKCGVRIEFERVALQPGKPTVFGRRGETVFFGLPGNPVSAFIVFEVLVKPLLFRMMGHEYAPPIASGVLAEPVSRRSDRRTQFLPVRLDAGRIRPLPYHGSAHLHALTAANAILTLPEGTASVAAGEVVDVRLL